MRNYSLKPPALSATCFRSSIPPPTSHYPRPASYTYPTSSISAALDIPNPHSSMSPPHPSTEKSPPEPPFLNA